MAFAHRVAALAAVVLIPVTIAGTSHVLGDDAPPPDVVPDVELADPPGESPSGPGSPTAPPDEEVVPRPRPTETSLHDDDRRPTSAPDAPGDDGPGDDGASVAPGDDDGDERDDDLDDDGDDD